MTLFVSTLVRRRLWPLFALAVAAAALIGWLAATRGSPAATGPGAADAGQRRCGGPHHHPAHLHGHGDRHGHGHGHPGGHGHGHDRGHPGGHGVGLVR